MPVLMAGHRQSHDARPVESRDQPRLRH
jgi:hypothetical protein